MGEDLGEEFILHLVELCESSLEHRTVLAWRRVEVFAQPVGGVVHQHLSVLDPLGISRQAQVDQMSVVVHLTQGGAGLFVFACKHLLSSKLGHRVDQLCIEEALLARRCLLGAKFELADCLGILRSFFVGSSGREREQEERVEE